MDGLIRINGDLKRPAFDHPEAPAKINCMVFDAVAAQLSESIRNVAESQLGEIVGLGRLLTSIEANLGDLRVLLSRIDRRLARQAARKKRT